ncbi:hypothetical protein QYE76_000228 [Lolium multiflorum]|uniref:RNase H type-1 domain-containing protein n=1 Tax=Lolium multiflorum TaxID=4521 RepID=A0AAD8RIR6_LOLMU|nr:hypothetical protein QYE76_000228 [Lolium multiflorum]
MASVVTPRRQLAPTVGPAAALVGDHIRAGILTISGERVVSGLVQRLGSLDFVNDNTGCFANGGRFLQNGRILEFGSHRVYLGTVKERQYPSPVLVAPDPPRSSTARGPRTDRAAGSLEVMMAGVGGAGKGTAVEGAGQTKSTRTAKPPTQRDEIVTGTSTAPPAATLLQAAMSVLAMPITQNIDPAVAQAELEAQRQKLLFGAADIVKAQQELNLTLREYNAAHGFASVSANPVRAAGNRLRGRNLDQDLRREVLSDHPKVMPNPGGYALVVDPTMHGPSSRVRFSKVLVDNGSSINIMYRHTMHTLGVTPNMLEPSHTTFHGIVLGLSCSPMGKVRVDVTFGGRDNCRVENVLFEVVDLDSPYHALLGRPALAKFMASTHTAYLKMKMPAPNGPLTVVGNYKVSLETTSARSNLAESLDAKPVRQPLRRFAEDRRKIIGEEVTKLLVSSFIVEVLHTEWLANPVLVEKKKKEDPKAPKAWRMCIDYTNLNKACPKDPFPLPRIDQADAAFKELKKMLATAPVLASPLEREPMLLYIAATNRVMSVVVAVEREEEGKTVQRPVYYLSEVLSLSKQNYPHFQKMTYGVFMAVTKLKHYFEEHPMKVVSEAPISDIIGNKDASGRIAKWAIQLSPYVPVYARREAIKSQALADFLVDWAEAQYKPPKPEVDYWKMHFDGSKLKEGLGAGVVLTSPKGDHLRYVLQIHFRASNNVTEYEALVHGLKVAKEIGAHQIICYGDSDLVVQQCSGDWDAKYTNMAAYRFHVQKIAGFFEGCEFHHIPRAENEAADTLSKLGSSRQAIPASIAFAHLRTPSIKPSPESESIFVPESHVVPMDIDEGNPGTTLSNPGTSESKPEETMMVDHMEIDVPVFLVREVPTWVKPIKEFLINGGLLADETESRRIQRRSKAYTIINGEMYKRSVTGVLQ